MSASQKPGARAAWRSFARHWVAVEAIPIYAIIGGVCVGASWYLYRLAMGPSVVWTKNNPQPWQSIKEGETTKMMTVNHEAKSWSRDKL
ncbi:hypothetical protein K488DRAFT_56137 [Vararia minispora EC-137]|uniref:Uncharacterized protein n=1 Tax=Vararia minispora EC-137 TaxID=1314806 RepID=A0ACB8QD52_9AGAM|nr:hypothetical protein K488DRAFT_56137 [Vararia minispora EC-137]